MAVAHDADSNANSGATAVASLTWSHTSTGSNLLLVVGLYWTGSTNSMSTITHAGNNPTGTTGQVAAFGASTFLQIWWWVNPTAGAQNIIATPRLSASIFGGGATFTGVNQTIPVNPLDMRSDSGNSFGLISSSLAVTGDNEMLFSMIGMESTTSTLTAAGGATQAFNQFNATPARTGAGEYLLLSNHGLNYGQWTISGSTARNWGHEVIAINPVGNVAIPHYKLSSSLRPSIFKPGLAR